MKYHEFLGQVQHRARLADLDAATRATRCTLETLGQRLFGGEAHNLAAQLPPEIGLHLDASLVSRSFGLDEFYLQVSLCEGVDLATAMYHVRAVFETLREAVSPGALDKALDQLPDEYDRLFEAVDSAEQDAA